MVNSAKRPSGKGSKLSEAELRQYAKALGTDNIGVENYRNKYRLNISRKCSQQYFGKPQQRVSTGYSVTDDDGRIIETNAELVKAKASEMHKDLALGYFDPTLVKYGLGGNPQLAVLPGGLPPKPKLGTLEIWERYLEYKRPTLKETTFSSKFSTYTNAVVQAVKSVGDDAIAIRGWLLNNRSLRTTGEVLSHLTHAYHLTIREGLITSNPFIGLTDDLPKKDKNQKVTLHDDESEEDICTPEIVKKKAFTTDEVNAIIDYIQHSVQGKHYYAILKFLFLTGCRTGEAIAFMWGDVKWDSECIVIRRSYCSRIKKFVTTKTGVTRFFPMPKDGELWNFLSSLKRGKDSDLVFPSKTGKVINHHNFFLFWHGSEMHERPGVIPTLIKQGKVSKYLPLYNTRHTFISYQINECGQAPHDVKDWCGHSERMTTSVYREVSSIAKPVAYGQKPVQQNEELSEVELLKRQLQQQQALIEELMKSRQ